MSWIERLKIQTSKGVQYDILNLTVSVWYFSIVILKITFGDPSETHMPLRRPIGDRHASSENNRRLTCLIGDLSKTDMPQRRPIRNTYLALLRVQNLLYFTPLIHISYLDTTFLQMMGGTPNLLTYLLMVLVFFS